MTGFDLAQFVGTHTIQCRFVGFRVTGNRNLCGHAAHRERAASVTGLNQQFRIRFQKRLRH